MIIRVTAPAGGLQYPAQKEANAKPVVLSFVITEKHAVKFDGPEMNFDDKIRVVFDSKEAAKKLVALGYTNIVEFGGILDWTGDLEKG